MIFGYFLGPLLVLAMTSVVASYYLTFYRTYDDIVNQRIFLTMLPLISVIPMALSNIIIGILVGKDQNEAGKSETVYPDGGSAFAGVRNSGILYSLFKPGCADGMDGSDIQFVCGHRQILFMERHII